jgi:hypothetical protein
MQERDTQNRVLENRFISEQELWAAIRYLDPDVNKHDAVTVINALVAAIWIICLIASLILFRRLG